MSIQDHNMEVRLTAVERQALITQERFEAHLRYHDGAIDARIDDRIGLRLKAVEENRDKAGDTTQRWISLLLAAIGIVLTLITAYAQSQSGGG